MIFSLLVLASFASFTCASRISCRCGGYQELWGKCGLGMYCDNCGLCRGCSTQVLIDYNRSVCNNTTCTRQPYYPGYS
ncbi:unnamed protein product [Nezara viridula]|uniref:Neuropeptide n=1 Tax=Nezara viridula TaxID=85310 RepID=A0A9P0HQQ6_NEZVI|nr:unnamed protein product [Nezara viridula]